jgi:hypothetical protein
VLCQLAASVLDYIKILMQPTDINAVYRPASSQSLYQLTYPCPLFYSLHPRNIDEIQPVVDIIIPLTPNDL